MRRVPRSAVACAATMLPFLACGPGSDNGGPAWSPGSSSSGGSIPGATSSSSGGGSPSDHDGGASSSTDGAPDIGDAGPARGSSSGADGAASIPDASGDAASGASEGGLGGDTGSAGLAPYKGVAGSACADLATLGVSWYYNWTLSPPSGCSAPHFVPMVWGHTGNEQTGAGITSEISGLVSGGYATVLGFNEPDNTTQSNISVSTAIALWPSFNNPALRIGSPATQGNSTGLTWITSFMSQVNADTSGKLRVDFIATHWYGWNAGSCDAKGANLESWLKQIEAIPGNRPIWLTEWGCLNQSNPTAAVVQSFFSGAIVMLAKHPRVERYAWFPSTTNNELIASAGGLTSLGTVFAAAPATR